MQGHRLTSVNANGLAVHTLSGNVSADRDASNLGRRVSLHFSAKPKLGCCTIVTHWKREGRNGQASLGLQWSASII